MLVEGVRLRILVEQKQLHLRTDYSYWHQYLDPRHLLQHKCITWFNVIREANNFELSTQSFLFSYEIALIPEAGCGEYSKIPILSGVELNYVTIESHSTFGRISCVFVLQHVQIPQQLTWVSEMKIYQFEDRLSALFTYTSWDPS